MKKSFALLFAILFLGTTGLAHAQDDLWARANSELYKEKAPAMLGRGLLNAASCFVDLAVQTVEGTQEGPPIAGTLSGIATGATCTVLRAASGVLDVASFWIPDFNGIPVSRSYSNCLAVNDTSAMDTMPSRAPEPVYAAPAPRPAPVIVEERPQPKPAPAPKKAEDDNKPREYDPMLSVKK